MADWLHTQFKIVQHNPQNLQRCGQNVLKASKHHSNTPGAMLPFSSPTGLLGFAFKRARKFAQKLDKARGVVKTGARTAAEEYKQGRGEGERMQFLFSIQEE